MTFEIKHNNKKYLYDNYLNQINDIKFTYREVDVITCIVKNRGEKKIANLLSISPKTINTHIHNIALKIGQGSREFIIDFIEKSGKLQFIKKYYLYILAQSSFDKKLIQISKTINTNKIKYHILAENLNANEKLVLAQLKTNLALANLEYCKNSKECEHSLHIIKPNLLSQQIKGDIFLILDLSEAADFNIESNIEIVDLYTDYYLGVFLILQKLINKKETKEIYEDFKKDCEIIKSSWEGNTQATILPNHFLDLDKYRSIIRKPIFSLILVCTILVIGAILQNVTVTHNPNKLNINSYDFPLPHQNILLKRTDLLEKIDKKLNEKGGIRTVVLVGPGGAGKTTISYQYARTKNKKSSLTWKINAETKETIIFSLKQLAYSICKTEEEKQELTTILYNKNEKEKEQKLFEFLKTKITKFPNWLVIFNNVRTFKDIQDYFPHDSSIWGDGKIIITTRDSNISSNNYINPDNVIHIGGLTSDEKLELFNKVITNCDPSSKNIKLTNNEFLEKLPPYPFDISLAATYLKVEKISYNKYLKEISEHREGFLAAQKAILNDIGEYNQTRYDIVTFSVKNLINIHHDFKDLLLFISLIDSKNISKDLLMAYKDEFVVSKFIHELKKFSLIREQSPATSLSPATFSIHHTTQQIILAYLTTLLNLDKNSEQLKYMSVALENYMSNELKIPNSTKISLLVVHFEMFLNHPKLINKIILANLNRKLGVYYFRTARYKEAKECFETALIIYEKNYGLNDINTAKVLSRLGSLYRNTGSYKKSKEHFEKALKIFEANYGKENISTIEIYTYLGSLYRSMGDYGRAKEYLELSLKVYERSYGRDNIETARVLAYLGSNYKNTGDYKKAQEFLSQALEVYKKYYGDDHVQTAWTLGRLGNVYRHIGECSKAKDLLTQTLIVYKKYYGENCIETAWILSHLGSVNASLGDNKEAQSNINQSLAIYKKHLDPNHVTIAWVLFHLGNVNINLGNFERAQQLLEKTLIIYRENYGNRHIRTAGVLNALGKTYLLKDNLEKAEGLINQALEIFEYNQHPDKYICLENLAEVNLRKSVQEESKGNIHQSGLLKKQSADYLKKSLEIIKISFPEDSFIHVY
jgi:tetratricopeptide (TPR) repeat protein